MYTTYKNILPTSVRPLSRNISPIRNIDRSISPIINKSYLLGEDDEEENNNYLKGESRYEQIPCEKSFIDYEEVETIEKVPVQRTFNFFKKFFNK